MVIDTPYGTASSGPDGAEVSGLWTQLHAWANRPGSSWPCSELATLDEVVATFDARGDLVDLRTVDASKPNRLIDLSGDELNAWTSDVLREAGFVASPALR